MCIVIQIFCFVVKLSVALFISKKVVYHHLGKSLLSLITSPLYLRELKLIMPVPDDRTLLGTDLVNFSIVLPVVLVSEF